MSPENLITSEFYLPYNQKLVARAKELRKNMTVPEKKLWYGFLNHFPLRVLKQRPIDNFIVDFYCAKLKLVIEVDGDSHFTDEGKESDRRRTEILEGYGLKVIRFTNDAVLDNFEAVCQAIAQEIPPTTFLREE
jgi:very-short-patch-repair endonuclease